MIAAGATGYAPIMGEDPTTEELRLSQLRRETTERREARQAEAAGAEPEAEQHARRAEKADYLRRKLEQRAEAERKAKAEESRDS